MSTAWLQTRNGTPTKIYHAFPLALLVAPRPSVITVVDYHTAHSFGHGAEICVDAVHRKEFILTSIRPIKPESLNPEAAALTTSFSSDEVISRFTNTVSDVICFRGKDVRRAAYSSIPWMMVPVDLRHQKPTAVFIVEDICASYRRDLRDLRNELRQHSGKCPENLFAKVILLQGDMHCDTNIDCIFDEALQQKLICKTCGQLWDWHTLSRMSKGFIQLIAAPKKAEYISPISCLEQGRIPRPLTEVQPWLAKHWALWFKSASSVEEVQTTCSEILAISLGQDRIMHYRDFPSLTVHSELYSHPIRQALAAQRDWIPEKAQEQVYERIKKTILSPFNPTKKKKKFHAFFMKNRSKFLCYGCFVNQADVFLPCGCAICPLCSRALGSPNELETTVFRFPCCTLCGEEYSIPWTIRLPPPTAGYRLLELDGGGIRGIVQIVVLKKIQESMQLPIRIFFDLIVGTSVGGINAICVGLLEWPLDLCEKNFISLAGEIFPTSCHSGIIGSLYKLGKLFFKDSLYPSAQSILRSAVGDHPLRGFRGFQDVAREQIKVAVTSIDCSSGKCGLLTSYNKSAHTKEKSYFWAEPDANTPVHKAAEITSAAPLYLPAVRTRSNRMFQDGLEIPLPQARSEGRKLWPHKEGPDFILSISCGKTRSNTNARSNFGCRFLMYSLTCLHPSIAYDKYTLARGVQQHDYRIDPVLDLDEVPLDDTGAIPSLQSHTEEFVQTNASFLSGVESLAGSMLASLFSFEFTEFPTLNPGTSTLRCAGRLICRYADDPDVKHAMQTIFNDKYIHVPGKTVLMRGAKSVRIEFSLGSWSRPFDILLSCNGRSACISGFPESVENLITHQGPSFYAKKEAVNGSSKAFTKRKEENFETGPRKRVKMVRSERIYQSTRARYDTRSATRKVQRKVQRKTWRTSHV